MLIDATLREGEQAFGAYFDPTAKREIFEMLAAAGVEEIETGWAGQEDLPAFLEWAAPRRAQAALGVWVPCRECDPGLVPLRLIQKVNIGVPVSERRLAGLSSLEREGLPERVAAVAASYLRAGAACVSVGLEDVTRADPDFALAVARAAAGAGARRLRLADTLGQATPLDMVRLIERFAPLGLPLAVHCHNDFGMATANAVSALETGAAFADVTALGLGERSGVAKLEELAAWLALKRRDVPAYDLTRVRALCAKVAELAGLAVSRLAPILGGDIFGCESGLHLHGMAADPGVYEPYPPEAVMAERVSALGKKSGRGAVRAVLGRLGLSPAEERLPELTREIRRLSAGRNRPLTEAELRALAAA